MWSPLPGESGQRGALSGPNQRQDFVYLEKNQEAGARLLLSGGVSPTAQGAQDLSILFFPQFSQVKSLALIAWPLFRKEVGGMEVGLEVAVSQVVGHDESYGLVLKDVGPGKYRHIHPACRVGSGQNSMPFGVFKVTA
jgi:hypothetical protein